MAHVQCKDCGFLSIRNKHTRELVEVENRIREFGDFPIEIVGDFIGVERSSHYEVRPMCFMLQPHLDDDGPDEVMNTLQFVNRIRIEIECDCFTPLKQGFSPKEHCEMLDRKLLLDWQERRENLINEREDRRDREQREWRREESTWRLRELIVMGVVVTAISAIVQIISAIIQRGR